MLAAFQVLPDDIYIIVLDGFDSKIPAVSNRTGRGSVLESADQLPPGELVISSPPVANHLAGTECLHGFTHPKEAIYVFGADNISLAPEFFGERAIDHTVYIPVDAPAELNSCAAAAMVFYDRRYKEWLTR
jgi:hypothetical protein